MLGAVVAIACGASIDRVPVAAVAVCPPLVPAVSFVNVGVYCAIAVTIDVVTGFSGRTVSRKRFVGYAPIGSNNHVLDLVYMLGPVFNAVVSISRVIMTIIARVFPDPLGTN
jgi:hypothetical protein